MRSNGTTPDPAPEDAEAPRSRGRPLRYERDPAKIYAESFAIVRREARLAHLPPDIAEIAVRLVHACGMTEIVDRLAFAPGAAQAGRAALAAGAPIFCDCEMVASGIIRRALPAGNQVVTTLNAPEAAARAQALATTRSAAAVTAWPELQETPLGGAVVAIGNAPTALFQLLELLDAGAPRPAVILGFPVGFVGAAESKAELARDPRGSAYLTLRGRRGGSALASAAVNALCLGASAAAT